MFSVGPKRVGNCVSLQTPLPSGPRQAGQFAATADWPRQQETRAPINAMRCIAWLSIWRGTRLWRRRQPARRGGLKTLPESCHVLQRCDAVLPREVFLSVGLREKWVALPPTSITGVHSSLGRAYPDDMSATDPVIPEPRDFPIRLPWPLWIGVATVVLVIVAVSIRFGMACHRQQAAICEIERVGGVVDIHPRGPEWLRQRLGNERMRMFDDVTGVHLSRTPAIDATLVCLKWLTNLQELSLCQTQVTDTGLAVVGGMSQLRNLWLDHTHVTDAGLIHLRSLTRLEILWLRHTQV